MKAVILIILTLSSITTHAFENNGVAKFLPNIRDRVRQCTILPYRVDQNHVRIEQKLLSHCPEVRIVHNDHAARGRMAKINVAGHQFSARLIETEFSDGDFYDVEIRDLVSNEIYRLDNVPAYGDILLGVLEGDTQGVSTTLIE